MTVGLTGFTLSRVDQEYIDITTYIMKKYANNEPRIQYVNGILFISITYGDEYCHITIQKEVFYQKPISEIVAYLEKQIYAFLTKP